MAKFCGEVGYGESIEVSPGVWDEVITERTYFGDIIKTARGLQDGTNINSDISTSNSISILADGFANEHFFAIRYIRWAGTLWTVSDVEVQRPRLLLRLGGVYHGPKEEVATDS